MMRRCLIGGLAALVISLLAAGAEAAPGFVGMQVQAISPKAAAALGLDAANGVLIRDIAPGGPAALAGFKRGDLIVGFAGAPTDTLPQLIAAVRKHHAGETVDVRVYRAGKTLDLRFTLGDWPAAWRVEEGAFANLPERGLTLAAVTPDVRKSFKLRWGSIGVLVTLVDPKFAPSMPLRRGDLIVEINQQPVWQPARAIELYRAAKKAGRHHLLLLVERASGFYFVLLPVG